jgi:hypothetical protein
VAERLESLKAKRYQVLGFQSAISVSTAHDYEQLTFSADQKKSVICRNYTGRRGADSFTRPLFVVQTFSELPI